jgi:hypothetical protein
MCFHPARASASRRRSRRLREPPVLPPRAMLDLSKPEERQAHDFLLRATSGRDRIWTLVSLRRLDDVLLCVVRWTHPDDTSKPFSLAEVSLTETAVRWRDHSSAVAACSELNRRAQIQQAIAES